MRVLTLFSIILTLAATLTAQVQSLMGKSGAGLAQAIRQTYSSKHVEEPSWGLIFKIDGGKAFDRFAGEDVHVSSLSDYVIDGMASPRWWKETEPSKDLHNSIAISREADAARQDYPLASGLERADYDNGVFQAGMGYISGTDTRLYIPPKGWEGDFARAIMYMAMVYGTMPLQPRGYTMMSGTQYPGLTRYAQRILRQFHDSDPVSDFERARNERVCQIQGNRNPFVDYPQLVDYLWGEKSGRPFMVDGEKIPLRGTYCKADGRIDFYSPRVPPDAVWSLDGHEVTTASIDVSSLSAGRHVISYTHTTSRGKLIITITE